MGRLCRASASLLRTGSPVLLALLLATLGSAPASAEYVFVSPSAKNQNRVYWLDRYTGTVGACQYQTEGAPQGTMLCFPPGENAQGMPSGDYDLKASNWDTEWGVFRVNRTTGEISLCFVDDDKVACTRQSIAR
jgi:hypothetical protein